MNETSSGIKITLNGIQQTLSFSEAKDLRKALKKKPRNAAFKSLAHILKILLNEEYGKM